MDAFDDVGTEAILSGDADWLTDEVADTLAAHPLDCVETEFPHARWSVESADETVRPSEDHPVFYGCFDWHSTVHSHWSLIRQRRLVDGHPRESAIVESLRRRVTPSNVDQEVEYFEKHESFEKPYGWAWLLRLAAELHLWDDDRAGEWRTLLEPLESRIVDLVATEFLPQDRPFRVGTHGNSAFALQAVLDYARVTDDESLAADASATARRFFADDEDAPVAYEPFGWDFLSPSLAEADLMRRVLDRPEFAAWLDGFLPDVTASPHESILRPVEVDANPDEDVALHLVGLNLSKAWSFAGIADSLPDHPRRDAFERAARRHVEDSIDLAFTDEYAGSHWLSTFVLYLGTRNAGGIAPA